MQVAAAHYDAQALQYGGQTKDEREDDAAIEVRLYNNWIKATLIDMYCRDQPTVLDLCCGKGGDFAKLKVSGVQQYVGADISPQALVEFRTRHGPSARLLTMDFTAPNEIDRHLSPHERFPIVSCQFAAHYAFRDASTIVNFLHNAASRLLSDGLLIMTVPKQEAVLAAQTRLQGHPFCRVEFPEPSSTPHLYLFSLSQAVQRCPEYLIDVPYLCNVAREQHVELVYRASFAEFEAHATPAYQALKQTMKVPATISKEARDVIDLYEILILQRY
jgi:mRNA (guanine-N7-)-methyltransferase